MKKYIEYYYNFHIEEIRFDSFRYNILSDNKKYIFKELIQKFDADNYNSIKGNLDNCFFSIVYNRHGNLITNIDNKQYILLRLTNIHNDVISIYDIKNNIYINNKQSNSFKEEWIKKWEQKIDYFEELLESKKEFYNKFYPLLQYYIGMGEIAVAYLKMINDMNNNIPTVQHYRLDILSDLYYYYDPTNIYIDHNSRDIAEYIKSAIISDMNIEEIIILLNEYLDNYTFSNYDIRMLYSRILFPTFFFDYIERIETSNQNNKIEENLMHNFENIVLRYENGIRSLNKLFKEKYNIRTITV